MKTGRSTYLLTPEDLHLLCDGQIPHYEPGVCSVRIVCNACSSEMRLKGPDAVRGRYDRHLNTMTCSGFMCWRGWSLDLADKMMVTGKDVEHLPVVQVTFNDDPLYRLVQKEDMGRAYTSLELVPDEEREQRVVDRLLKMRENIKARF